MAELIHAFTETHYKNYPAYINISKHAGEQIVLIVREQENNGTKCASIKLSIKELEYLAKDINNHLKIEDRNYTAIEEQLEAAKQRELEMQEPYGYWIQHPYTGNVRFSKVAPDPQVMAMSQHIVTPLYAKPFPAPKQEEK